MAHFFPLSILLLSVVWSPVLGVTCPGVNGYCSASFPGQVCNVVCSRGRPVVPVCQKDGTWTAHPRCIEHEPGKEEQVAGICIGVPGYCSLSFAGNRCQFKCPRGPPIDSVCAQDGTWKPYPTCQGDIRDTQDGCSHCPGPNGKFRNRTAEAIFGITPSSRSNEIFQDRVPKIGFINNNYKTGSRIGGSRHKISISTANSNNGKYPSQQRSHKTWRDDGRCGLEYPLRNGQPSQCNPISDSCCAPSGWCGHTDDHCLCEDCINYSQGTVSRFPQKRPSPSIQSVPSHIKKQVPQQHLIQSFSQQQQESIPQQQYPKSQKKEKTQFISHKPNLHSTTHQGVQPRPVNFHPINNIHTKTTPQGTPAPQATPSFQHRPNPQPKNIDKPFIKPEPIIAVPNPTTTPAKGQQTFGIFPAVDLSNPEAGVFNEPRVPRIQQNQNNDSFYGVFEEVELKR